MIYAAAYETESILISCRFDFFFASRSKHEQSSAWTKRYESACRSNELFEEMLVPEISSGPGEINDKFHGEAFSRILDLSPRFT